jgi:hypothetical protein
MSDAGFRVGIEAFPDDGARPLSPLSMSVPVQQGALGPFELGLYRREFRTLSGLPSDGLRDVPLRAASAQPDADRLQRIDAF